MKTITILVNSEKHFLKLAPLANIAPDALVAGYNVLIALGHYTVSPTDESTPIKFILTPKARQTRVDTLVVNVNELNELAKINGAFEYCEDREYQLRFLAQDLAESYIMLERNKKRLQSF